MTLERSLLLALANKLDEPGESNAPAAWEQRIPGMFPQHFTNAMSAPHAAIWEWAAGIDADSHPAPFVALWPRGRGKSTHAEAIAVDLGARGKRQYCIYVSGTQDQADTHIRTIAHMMESPTVTRDFPQVGEPKVGSNGGRTWNRRIMTTANGFTVEAVGLNKAVRGQKIDWARPDLIIFDDVDGHDDTAATTLKKLDIITSSILPAGAPNVAVLFVQNVIHADSIAAMLGKPSGDAGSAQFLMDRVISGPYPAVEGLEYEAQPDGEKTRWVITAGTSLWDGYDLSVCEDELNRVGPPAFERESQHNVDEDSPHPLLSAEDFERTRVMDHPPLYRIGIGVDPPGGAGTCGIIVGGKARLRDDWHGYTLEDASTAAGVSPNEWALAVLDAYYRHGADEVYVEINFGGEMVISTLRNAKLYDANQNLLVNGARIAIRAVRASRGKKLRAQPVAVVFQQGRGHHVGHFSALERQWRTYEPDAGMDSPDRLDAEVWLYAGLGLADWEPPKQQPFLR